MLLAIDTATRVASLALYDADGLVAESTWRARENHTIELTAQIVSLLQLAHTPTTALKAIGVALGPGSFTGLRVGMSIGKGLAFGAGIPLFGVPTLDVIAHANANQSIPIWAVVAAGRGRYSVARYAARRGAVKRTSDYSLLDAAGLVDLACRDSQGEEKVGRALFCGDLDAALASLLVERVGTRAVVASPASNARRAGFLAELAWARLARGESDDVASLSPIYTPIDSGAGIIK
jgi:tRNA threonylcarbamoyladenosine biosynthesis protein TsaB